MNRLGDLLDRDADELARLETLQTGTAYKLRRESDFAFATDNLRFFATQIRNLEGKAADEYSGTHTSIVRREPIGVVGQVSPWNYPMWMAIWKIGPALAAGNSIVLKPASATPLTTIRLAELAIEAGVPDGVFNVVTGRGDVVGAAIAAHLDVDLITLTGDTETGKQIQALASWNVKRVHLELGGKAPFIVSADADLEAAARGATAGALINGGQDCTAATRAYVHRSLYDAFLARTKELFEGVRVGDPFDPDTDLGTLISAGPGRPGRRLRPARRRGRCDGRDRRRSTGGARLPRRRVLPPDARSPTAPRTARSSRRRSSDRSSSCCRSTRTTRRSSWPTTPVRPGGDRSGPATCSGRWRPRATLNFGHVQVNDHLMVTSEMPHGGFKQSGFGKDMSTYSFEEYTQVKHVMIELTGEPEKDWHYTIFGDDPAQSAQPTLTSMDAEGDDGQVFGG